LLHSPSKIRLLVEFAKEGSWSSSSSSSSRFDRRLIGGGEGKKERRGERQEEMEVLSLVWLGAAWSRLIENNECETGFCHAGIL